MDKPQIAQFRIAWPSALLHDKVARVVEFRLEGEEEFKEVDWRNFQNEQLPAEYDVVPSGERRTALQPTAPYGEPADAYVIPKGTWKEMQAELSRQMKAEQAPSPRRKRRTAATKG